MLRFLLLTCSAIFLFSCSLTYTEDEPDVTHVPELIFSNAEYLSYEDGKNSMSLQTNLLEQYRSDNAFYAMDVSFFTYTKEGELSTQGSCEMIAANSDDKEYTLLGNVVVDSVEEDILFNAQSIQWNGRTEQLITNSTESVHLIRGKRKWDKTLDIEQENLNKSKSSPESEDEGAETWIEMTGRGFSSSSTSMSFNFTGEVSGLIYTRKKQESQK